MMYRVGEGPVTDGPAEPRPLSAETLEPYLDGELWTPQYGTYDPAVMFGKLDQLRMALLKSGADQEAVEIAGRQSAELLRRIFPEYHADAPTRSPGSFAFVVPARVRREINGQNDDYVSEWYQLYPILRFVDSTIAQRFLVGTPPCIVDQYGLDARGQRGYMIFAPFFADMPRDVGRGFSDLAARIMNDTFRYVGRLGVRTVGLGATLPKLLFNFDKRGIQLDDKNLDITTGHAGTVWMIGETLKAAHERGYPGSQGNIGVLGAAGSIGSATVAYLREELEFNRRLHLYDERQERLASMYKGTGLKLAPNTGALIEASDTLICAVTTPISLAKLNLRPNTLAGKAIIDDSQPGCFDPAEVASYGGQVLWVIGQDPTDSGEITRQSFNYSGFGPVGLNEIWGCELEAWTVERSRELGSLAVRSEVKVVDVARLGRALSQLGVHAAPLQAQGRYV